MFLLTPSSAGGSKTIRGVDSRGFPCTRVRWDTERRSHEQSVNGTGAYQQASNYSQYTENGGQANRRETLGGHAPGGQSPDSSATHSRSALRPSSARRSPTRRSCCSARPFAAPPPPPLVLPASASLPDRSVPGYAPPLFTEPTLQGTEARNLHV